MLPGGMFAYHRWAKPRNARTSVFALHAVPPPAASGGFILEEELFRVRLAVKLRQYCCVEAMRPLYFL